jgi:protein involved in polysaccharide export with SLBB domain
VRGAGGWSARQRAAIAWALAVAATVATPAAAQTSRADLDRALGRDTAAGAPAVPQKTPAVDEETRARARFFSPELLDASVDAQTYVLGAGDLLAIALVVGETRSEVLPVLPEGVVMIPNVGPVPAAGRTVAEFRTALQTAVARRYRDFELHCYLARPRQFRVWVTGEVRDPGMVAARAYERVSDVVDRAGGLLATASRREIELCDANGAVRERVDLAAFLSRGDARANPRLADGQIVRVPARRRAVEIEGAVAAPGTYEPRRGEALRDLLALAGGPLPTADTRHVTVEHTDAQGAVRITTYDLDADTPETEDATRVSILEAGLGRRRAFVMGPAGETTAYPLADGETLAGLARRAAALGPDADVRRAELSTHDADGRQLQVPVDLVAALDGRDDRVVQDGDVLSVPPVKEYVYVSGYVTRPGRYAYRGDWTIGDYVGEAGGPTAGGSRDRAVIVGTDGDKRKGDRRSAVQRGETIYLDRSLGGKASSTLGLLANLSALIISIVALNR